MAINFPDNPTSNQIYSEVDKSWKWNGTAWVGIASTGPQGEPGVDGDDGAPGEQGPKGDIGLQGFVGETGVIQETQVWENVTYNFNQDYTNDTGAPLDIRLYVQNDNTAAGVSDISVHALIGGLTVSFVESFRLAGAGAHDDVGNITIPTGATFRFQGSIGGGTPNLVWKRMVRTQVIVEQQTPSVTGTATFLNESNRITLPTVGSLFGLYVGDVIQVTGSNFNDDVYTVEQILNNDQVIVNAAHAGGTTSKSLTLETGTASVTVTLVCKAKNAPLGYGQGWVAVTRTSGALNTNSTGRAIMWNSYYRAGAVSSNSGTWEVDGLTTHFITSTNLREMTPSIVVPDGLTYEYTVTGSGAVTQMSELR